MELEFRKVNGEKVLRIDCIVDSKRRSEVQRPDPTETVAADHSSDDEEGEESQHSDGKVYDRWRLISAVETWPTTSLFFKPQMVDWSHENGKVLKQAVRLINKSRPDLTWDHSISSKDVCGHVQDAKWEDSKDIPPGVNGTVVVDPDYDAKAAKGLANKVLRSGSIGLSMDVVQSHPDMDVYDFMDKQGKMVDGVKVRWLPKKIYDVRHMALVPAGAGADPNAGRRESANNVAADMAAHTESGGPGMEKLLVLLQMVCDKLGIEAVLSEDVIPADLGERIEGKLNQYPQAFERYNALMGKLEALATAIEAESVDAMWDQMRDVVHNAQYGKRILDFKREEAIKAFDAAKRRPDKAEFSEAEKKLRDRLEHSDDLDFLDLMSQEYRSQAEERYGRRTSEHEELPQDNHAPVIDAAMRNIQESSGRLFGKNEVR